MDYMAYRMHTRQGDNPGNRVLRFGRLYQVSPPQFFFSDPRCHSRSRRRNAARTAA